VTKLEIIEIHNKYLKIKELCEKKGYESAFNDMRLILKSCGFTSIEIEKHVVLNWNQKLSDRLYANTSYDLLLYHIKKEVTNL
jgi:hypothetical protein